MQAVGYLNSDLVMSRIIFFVERAVISDQLRDNEQIKVKCTINTQLGPKFVTEY